MAEESRTGFIWPIFASIARRRRVLLAAAVLAALAWAGQGAWRLAQGPLQNDARYLVTAQSIQISTPPPWVREDVRSQAVARAGLQGPLSVLDSAQLPARLAEAFRLEPWVKSVQRVEVIASNQVQVDVKWRQPIAVVELAADSRVTLLPVDDQGVRLPEPGLSEAELRRLPRITPVYHAPTVGDTWTDPQVTGALLLVCRLHQDWARLSLANVTPSVRPEIRGDQQFYHYELLTIGGTHIVWGAAPHVIAPDEPAFDVKLARLKQFVTAHGVELNSEKSPQVIDLRYGLDTKRRIAKNKSENRTAQKEKAPEDASEMVK